jgi:hypothetical protein
LNPGAWFVCGWSVFAGTKYWRTPRERECTEHSNAWFSSGTSEAMTQATRKVRPINTVRIGVGVDDWTLDAGWWAVGGGRWAVDGRAMERQTMDATLDDLASNWKSRIKVSRDSVSGRKI